MPQRIKELREVMAAVERQERELKRLKRRAAELLNPPVPHRKPRRKRREP